MEKPDFSERIIEIPDMKFAGKKIKINEFVTKEGEKGRWESLSYAPINSGAQVFGLTPDKKVILVNIFRFPVNDWVIELPGGVLEEGENELEAAKREFLEETGYEGENYEKLADGYVWSGGTDQKYTIYLAKNCKKIQEPMLDPVEKFIGVKVIEIELETLISEIASKNNYDLMIAHALLALQAKFPMTDTVAS